MDAGLTLANLLTQGETVVTAFAGIIAISAAVIFGRFAIGLIPSLVKRGLKR